MMVTQCHGNFYTNLFLFGQVHQVTLQLEEREGLSIRQLIAEKHSIFSYSSNHKAGPGCDVGRTCVGKYATIINIKKLTKNST